MQLSDSHAHLDRYPDAALQLMLRRARQAGVERILAVATTIASSRRTLAIAAREAGVVPAVGVHPLELRREDVERALAAVARLVSRAAAVGEVGLEYAPTAASADAQRSFLVGCIEIARRSNRPLSLHVVGPEAHEDAPRLLRQHGPVPAVVHYFTGGPALAERYLDAGCAISVGKPVMRQELAGLQAAVARIPLDRLLLETDAYPLPGRTTEPRDLPRICAAVAALRGDPPEDVARATSATFARLFGSAADARAEQP